VPNIKVYKKCSYKIVKIITEHFQSHFNIQSFVCSLPYVGFYVWLDRTLTLGQKCYHNVLGYWSSQIKIVSREQIVQETWRLNLDADNIKMGYTWNHCSGLIICAQFVEEPCMP
jgi:hypothetical protein